MGNSIYYLELSTQLKCFIDRVIVIDEFELHGEWPQLAQQLKVHQPHVIAHVGHVVRIDYVGDVLELQCG
jgi:hypothetical protein